MVESKHDVIIVGGGIAAHSAAIYASRNKLDTLVLTAPSPDQLSLTSDVENYAGFVDGVRGPELIQNSKKQAEKFGAKYMFAKVDKVEARANLFSVSAGKKVFECSAVIIATGSSARMLGIGNEMMYFGKGLSVCAVCDGAFYKEKEVVVLGGGDSAMEEALILAKFASKVTIIHRKDKFRASKILQDRVFAEKDKIGIIWDSVVEDYIFDKKINGVKIKNSKTGKSSEVLADGVFLAIGHIPNTDFLKGFLKLDDNGYIITQRDSSTSVEGVFAAGDCQESVYRQAVVAAGTGAIAAIRVGKYLEEKK